MDPVADDIIAQNILGWSLYAHDQAAWHGSDAVIPLLERDAETANDRVTVYIAEETPDGWRVGFGRLAADSSAFLVAYEAVLDQAFRVDSAMTYDDPVARKGFMRDAALARDAAVAQFEAPYQIQYNTAVVPTLDSLIHVYILPSQPDPLVYYVGGDVRVVYDPKTGEASEPLLLHEGIRTYDLRDDPQVRTFMEVDTLPLGVPSATDVFYAMSRPGPEDDPYAVRPVHRIVTLDYQFLLGPRGTVSFDRVQPDTDKSP